MAVLSLAVVRALPEDEILPSAPPGELRHSNSLFRQGESITEKRHWHHRGNPKARERQMEIVCKPNQTVLNTIPFCLSISPWVPAVMPVAFFGDGILLGGTRRQVAHALLVAERRVSSSGSAVTTAEQCTT